MVFGISSGRPFASDSTPASFWKVRIFYLPSFKPYNEDLVKRLINSLSARWVRSKVNIPHQSAIPKDMRPRGHTIARSERIDPHRSHGKKENSGTESQYIRTRLSFLKNIYNSLRQIVIPFVLYYTVQIN